MGNKIYTRKEAETLFASFGIGYPSDKWGNPSEPSLNRWFRLFRKENADFTSEESEALQKAQWISVGKWW